MSDDTSDSGSSSKPPKGNERDSKPRVGRAATPPPVPPDGGRARLATPPPIPAVPSEPKRSSDPAIARTATADRRAATPPPIAPRTTTADRAATPPPVEPRTTTADRRAATPPPVESRTTRAATPPPVEPRTTTADRRAATPAPIQPRTTTADRRAATPAPTTATADREPALPRTTTSRARSEPGFETPRTGESKRPATPFPTEATFETPRTGESKRPATPFPAEAQNFETPRTGEPKRIATPMPVGEATFETRTGEPKRPATPLPVGETFDSRTGESRRPRRAQSEPGFESRTGETRRPAMQVPIMDMSGPAADSGSETKRADSVPEEVGKVESVPRIPTAAIAHVTGGQWRKGLPTTTTIAHAILWIVVAAPALYQLGLLGTAIAGRFGYSYDLEWMEGGMLHHALRIQEGRGIYVPPSIDFIPYLYTPLYPALLAIAGSVFGLSYALGRFFSVASLVGIALVAFVSLRPRDGEPRGPAIAGAVLALGLFAAVYPYLEGWFDLVRADTLFLFMVTAGIAALPAWSREGSGWDGHARVAAGGALLALAFFCKQTGIIYVALGGFIVLVTNWRRVVAYVGAAGLLGLGGTAMLQASTDGWFWTYVSRIHRAHDFNMDRFWKSFENILWHFPIMTIVVAATVLVVVVTAIRFRKAARRVPRAVWPFVLWTVAFAVSTVVGAVGWGTEFAHFNAYMPAFLHGALAAGAAVPAIYACARMHAGETKPSAPWIGLAAAVVVGGLLASVCWTERWKPAPFVPTPADEAAGDALIARLKTIEGKVFMPSHPWYLQLAGKPARVHRMGIKDVTWRQPRKVAGLDEALREKKFAALVLDDADLHNRELPVIVGLYRPAYKLPKTERPRVFSGARVVPDAIWIPIAPAKPPPDMHVLFDFEQTTWANWTKTGAAWGNSPVTAPHPGQGFVLGATGARFATSMHDGDKSTGRLTSPTFEIDSPVLLLKLGGGTDETKLRAEVWVDDQIVATASVPKPGGEDLKEVMVDLGAHQGKRAKLVLVDDTPTGHLNIDDVWARNVETAPDRDPNAMPDNILPASPAGSGDGSAGSGSN